MASSIAVLAILTDFGITELVNGIVLAYPFHGDNLSPARFFLEMGMLSGDGSVLSTPLFALRDASLK
jgi:hypothetical protein